MEHKHTGPWITAKYSKRRIGIGQPGGPAIYLIQCQYGDADDETSRVDTRLMAAAPDLLKAARIALEVAESHIKSDYEGTPDYKPMMAELDFVRAAIAKATGEPA